jgi:hypothetical protein
VREGFSCSHSLRSTRAALLINHSNSPSTSEVGLNFSTTSAHPLIYEWAKENFRICYWAMGHDVSNSSNPPQTLIGTSH